MKQEPTRCADGSKGEPRRERNRRSVVGQASSLSSAIPGREKRADPDRLQGRVLPPGLRPAADGTDQYAASTPSRALFFLSSRTAPPHGPVPGAWLLPHPAARCSTRSGTLNAGPTPDRATGPLLRAGPPEPSAARSNAPPPRRGLPLSCRPDALQLPRGTPAPGSQGPGAKVRRGARPAHAQLVAGQRAWGSTRSTSAEGSHVVVLMQRNAKSHLGKDRAVEFNRRLRAIKTAWGSAPPPTARRRKSLS